MRYGLLLGLLLLVTVALARSEPVREGRFRTSDGVRLHFLERGQGPPLVLVPGWTMPGEIFEPQIAHFSARHRVIAFDPRSQGKSERPAQGHYPERRAQDLRELLEHLDLQDVVLVSWSNAVPEVLTYVERYGTGGIRAFVFIDGAMGLEMTPAVRQSFMGMLDELQRDRVKFTEAFVRRMYHTAQSEEYLQKIVRASLYTPTDTAVVLVVDLLPRMDMRAMLGKLDRPVLYVQTPAMGKQARMIREKIPGARVEVFEEAGHALFVDEADRFNRLLEEFLGSLAPARGRVAADRAP